MGRSPARSTWFETIPVEQTVPWTRVARSESSAWACRPARELRRRPGKQCAHLRRDLAAVEDSGGLPALPSEAGRSRPGAEWWRERSPPSSRARAAAASPTEEGPAPDEQALSRMQIESDGQRPVGRLQHLGEVRRPLPTAGRLRWVPADAGATGILTRSPRRNAAQPPISRPLAGRAERGAWSGIDGAGRIRFPARGGR